MRHHRLGSLQHTFRQQVAYTATGTPFVEELLVVKMATNFGGADNAVSI